MVVFARLDCPAHDKVILLAEFLVWTSIREEERDYREREGLDWDCRPTAQTQRVQHCVARRRRRCDQPGCVPRRAIDDPPVPTSIFAGNQFGALERDDVVKQEHRFYVGTSS